MCSHCCFAVDPCHSALVQICYKYILSLDVSSGIDETDVHGQYIIIYNLQYTKYHKTI